MQVTKESSAQAIQPLRLLPPGANTGSTSPTSASDLIWTRGGGEVGVDQSGGGNECFAEHGCHGDA